MRAVRPLTEELLYARKGSTIGSVNPGVFLYWTVIEAPATSFMTRQPGRTAMQGTPSNPPLFRLHVDGPKLFDTNCRRVRGVAISTPPLRSVDRDRGQVPLKERRTTTLSAHSQSISGTTISGSPEFRATYAFSTLLDGNLIITSPDSLLLR